jgi:hypothetical protein
MKTTKRSVKPFSIFLQVEGNEVQLEILKRLVAEADTKKLYGDVSFFQFGSGTIDEHAAKQLSNVDLCGCYIHILNMCSGKLVLPFTEEDIPENPMQRLASWINIFLHFKLVIIFTNDSR